MSKAKNKTPEAMADFFDSRAATYEQHMKESTSFEQLYSTVASCIIKTKEKPNILDIGCGTGLELEGVFYVAPNAHITGIDVSDEMLNQLKERYGDHTGQLTLQAGSYLILPLGKNKYDYVVSVMTLHHLLPETKLKIYRKIKNALKTGGKYVEGDFIVSKREAAKMMRKYIKLQKTSSNINDGSHHIDIPFTIDVQKQLLTNAGFSEIEVIWKEENAAVITAIA